MPSVSFVVIPTKRCRSKGTESSISTVAVGLSKEPRTSRLILRGSPSMTMKSELTIIIPAKNEAKLIPNLLSSLILQDYPQISSTKIYLADAGSTDGTPEIASSYGKWLDIDVIPGGLPSVGRNAGASRACTPYVLVLVADMELLVQIPIRSTVEFARLRDLD